MNLVQYNLFCKALPHATHVVQWGGAHVWKVGAKVFAIGGWQEAGDAPEHLPTTLVSGSSKKIRPSKDNVAVTFKCSQMSFDILKEQPGCRPAPYLASRGMLWIQWMSDTSVSDAELKAYLRESYRLAALNLPKKVQRELGLAPTHTAKRNA